MINTLLEHVPIKMETKDEVTDVNDEDDEHIEDDDDVANSDDDGMEEDNEDDEDDDDEDEVEDEALYVEQEVTMLMSSDEEAELEAQRIRFPEKRCRKKSHDSKSSRSASRNSNVSSVSVKDKEKDDRSNSRNSNISTSTQDKDQGRNSDNGKEKPEGKEQDAKTKPDVVIDVLRVEYEEPKAQERTSPSLRKENPKNLDNVPATTIALASDLRQTLRRESNNSTCSVGSSVASDCAETESCANIYVYFAQQRVIFNCEFCDLKYGELESLGRHLHEAHRLFTQQDEDHEKENSPRNPRNGQNSQTPIQKQIQQQQYPLSVKKEHFKTVTDPTATTAATETPTTATATATELMPPVALNLDKQSEHSLQSCGNVFVLNHRKLFLICGYCECKYANKELFERHLRQQHDVFEIPPHNEVNVMPKREIKEEVFIITEVVEKSSNRNGTSEAMVTIPAETPLDISTNEIIQEEDEPTHVAEEVASPEIVQENEQVTHATEEVRQDENENKNDNDNDKVCHEVVVVQQFSDATPEEENVEQPLPESPKILEAVVLDDTPDVVTSTVISSSIQILDTGITIAEIPVIFAEESSAQISVPEELIAVDSSSTHNLSSQDTFIIEEIQEIHEMPASPPRPKVRSRKRRSSPKENEETAESPVKRPKRNTRKIVELKPDSPETKAKSSSTRRSVKKKNVKAPDREPHPKLLEIVSNNDYSGQQTESEAASTTPASPPQTTTTVLTKQVKKEKKTRKSINAKLERDSSPPRIIHIQQAESQIDDRDEEFIEDPVADIIEQIQQEINDSSKRGSKDNKRTLPPTTLLGLSQSAADARPALSPNITPQMSTLNSPVDVKPIIYVLGERHFVCDQCPRSFKKHARLIEHKRLHTGEKPFVCDECGKKFRMRLRLTEHKLRHSKERKFICEICQLGCCTKQDLNMHMRHHTNDRRFQCTVCPKAFVRSSDLKIHVRVHTGEKPYICDICHKCFRANQNLSVHKKSHMGEASKTYKCEQCDKKFMRNIDRKVHMRSHTGEKPFKCEICGRAYSSRFNVRAHIERDHILANGMSTAPRGKKKPGPKPKALKEELEKQRILIEELQAQLKRQIKTDEMIIPDDHSMNESCHEDSIMEVTESDTTPEGFEIIHSPPSLPLTAIPSPSSFDNPFTKSLKKPSVPATVMQKIEQHTSASSSMSPMMPSPQKQTTTKVVSQKTSLGIQQVSVTVSMQVENVATNSATPEKENTSISNMQITAQSVPTTTTSVKKERKITSYFTVLGQKAEV